MKRRDQVQDGQFYIGADGYAHRRRKYHRERHYPAKISIQLSDDQLAELRTLADEHGLSLPAIIRRAIADGLKTTAMRLRAAQMQISAAQISAK